MDLDKSKGTGEPVAKNTETSVRRTFLKKTAAGVVLTSLPAHSVWGAVCSVSGAMSGNMSGIQRHKDCVMPILPSGNWPGFWEKMMSAQDHTAAADLHKVFNGVKKFKTNDSLTGENAVKRECLLTSVQSVGGAYMQVDTSLQGPSFETNIGQAILGRGGVDRDLAAVWLNIYFNVSDFAGQVGSEAVANSVVEQLLAYITIQVNQGIDLPKRKDLYNYYGGKSSYLPSSC